jgi:hypothetical protein
MVAHKRKYPRMRSASADGGRWKAMESGISGKTTDANACRRSRSASGADPPRTFWTSGSRVERRDGSAVIMRGSSMR